MLTKKQLLKEIKGMIGKKPEVGTDFSEREGDDGQFGRRLEEALGVKENNSQNADVTCIDGDVELKTHNTDSGCRTSVFTKEPTWNADKGFNRIHDVITEFPTSNSGGVTKCNTTITTTPNNKGLSIKIDDSSEKISIVDSNNTTIGHWDYDQIRHKLNQKCGDSVIVVSRNKSGIVQDAEMYSGGDFDNLKEMLRNGKMVIEIRAKTGTSKKNRGTVFRTSNKYMPDLFKGVSDD